LEPGAFSSQSEVNPEGHASSSSGKPRETVRKVKAVISLRFGREIDNQVKSSNEPCRYSYQFFQNSVSSSSSPPKIGLSREPGDATNGVPNDSDTHLPSDCLRKRSLKRKTPLIQLTLHLLRVLLLLLLLLLRKSKCFYLLFPIGLRRKIKLMLRR